MSLPKIFQQNENGLLSLTPYGAPAPYLRLDTENPDSSVVVGSTYWDASEDTAVTHRSNGKAYAHGSELWKRCINKTGSEIPNGTPVYVVGAQGDRPKIAPGGATTAAKSKLLGVTTETIANNAEGDVLIQGDLNDIDTTGFTLGDEVWLGTTDGTIVNAAPGNGYQRVYIGIVTRIHASAGRIQISPYRYPMANEILRETWGDLLLLGKAKVGVSAPTFAQFGAKAFWAYKMAAGNIFYVDDGQMPHPWDLGVIRPHIHFSSDNGGTGSITFEHRIMSRPASSGTWSAEVVATKSWTGTLAVDAGAVLNLWDGLGYAPPSPGPSTLFKTVLTMTAKTFTGNVFIDGYDIHYKCGSFGTDTEF